MGDRILGFLGAVAVGGTLLGGQVVWREWTYYQQLKAEHQWLHEEPIGTLPGGGKLTRKVFIDLLIAEAARKAK